MQGLRKHTSILLNLDQYQMSLKQFWTKDVLNIVSQAMVAFNSIITFPFPFLELFHLYI